MIASRRPSSRLLLSGDFRHDLKHGIPHLGHGLVEGLIQDALAGLHGTLDIGDLLLELPPLLTEVIGRQVGALMVQLLFHRAQPVFLLGDFVLIGLALRFELLLNALRGSRFL